MLVRNIPFSLDAHLQTPFDTTADLCEVEVLRKSVYLRELREVENTERFYQKLEHKPGIEYLFTASEGLKSVILLGKSPKELPLTKERAERAYQLIDAMAGFFIRQESGTGERTLIELLAVQGYEWDEYLLEKSIDYDEKKMLAAVKQIQLEKENYLQQQKFTHSQTLQKSLPLLDDYHREEKSDGCVVYRTDHESEGRLFLTDIIVTPFFVDATHKGWELDARVSLEERPVPFCTLQQYCLSYEYLEPVMSSMVKKLQHACHLHLSMGDIKKMPKEEKKKRK